MIQARSRGLARCGTCGLLVRLAGAAHPHCPRCTAVVHARTANGIARTWALLVAAVILYIPANLLPVMTVTSLGSGQPDTIMSGVISLYLNGYLPLAAIVFVASILVPVLKMLALCHLLISVHRKSPFRHHQRIRLYRITEFIGRWSMVDLFVVALMTALVQAGNIATIEPGQGARAFATVVILTLFAAMSFDPRLIWDHKELDSD
ncbi:MAG: paraquat-inducible protein A [Porticoccaceae bacterium]